MLNQKNLSTEDALNKLSLVAAALRLLALLQEDSDLGALLQLLNTDLIDCLLTLDPPPTH